VINGNGHPEPEHADPALLVTLDHEGMATLSGCDACRSLDVERIAGWLEVLAARLRAHHGGSPGE
jgi:hypothetical protein